MEHDRPGSFYDLQKRAINLGLDLQGGIHLVMEVDREGLTEEEGRDAVDRAQEVIRNRVDQFGVAEPTIQRQGENRIIVELPGLQDVDRAKNLIGRTALLEFQLVEPDEDRSRPAGAHRRRAGGGGGPRPGGRAAGVGRGRRRGGFRDGGGRYRGGGGAEPVRRRRRRHHVRGGAVRGRAGGAGRERRRPAHAARAGRRPDRRAAARPGGGEVAPRRPAGPGCHPRRRGVPLQQPVRTGPKAAPTTCFTWCAQSPR